MIADAVTVFFGSLPILVFLVVIVGSVFWLWMLVDCIRNTRLNDTEKIIWVLVVLLLHFIGALLYCLLARGGTGRRTTP